MQSPESSRQARVLRLEVPDTGQEGAVRTNREGTSAGLMRSVFPRPCHHAGPATGRCTSMIKKILIALTAGAMAFTASACNTVRGVGDDLGSAADAVDKEM